MVEIASSEPCLGDQGTYQFWVHYVTPGISRSLRHVRSTLLGKPTEIEEALELPNVPNPDSVLRLARRFAANRFIREGLRPQAIAATSLIRVCNRAQHGKYRASSASNSERLEAVARDLWLPSALGSRVLMLVSPVELDESGVGRVRLAGPSGAEMTRSVVSVPLTYQEREQYGGNFAVPIVDSGAIFGLVHPIPNKGHIERLHIPYIPQVQAA